MPAAEELTGDSNVAIEFLRQWCPKGLWVLTAIEPDTRKAQTQTYMPGQEKEAEAWISWWQGKRNIYFSVNQPREGVTRKTEKADIQLLLALHVDIDPVAGVDIEAEQRRILALLQSFAPAPSVIVYSGGGYQGFWLMREPVVVEQAALLEAYNKGIEKSLGGDHCFNIDRIMRLPGTINVPDKKKLAKGRRRAVASVVSADFTLRYDLSDFTPLKVEELETEREKEQAENSSPAVKIPRTRIPDWCERTIHHGHDPEGERDFKGDRSKAVWAVACTLVRSGWTDEEIAACLLSDVNGISGHVRDQVHPEVYARRQAVQARKTVGTDFTRNDKKAIVPNQSNIRLALARLDVVLSYDAFSRRNLIEGPEGESVRHLEDPDIRKLYLMLEERWGFRLRKEYFNDVVENEAQDNEFHPVKDYLAGLKWDGERRIDTWLTTYAGAKDSSYTRAVGAITLVAAVRRVRSPGCKFDEMLTLESATQGLDKSSSLAALAVNPAWFTDSLPLDAKDKEVIEQLGGKWIAEAPELKGMRGTKVEHLKAFLSRQTDRARLSYARQPTEVPRQCIIIGTTNSETYLRDTTGNRRFWPVKITKLDIKRIIADRDQLWAEAGARESAGESIRLDPSLYEAAGLEQDRRLIEDPWVGIIQKEIGKYSYGRILAADLWTVINVPIGQRTQDHNARLGDTMREIGWERAKLRIKDNDDEESKPQWCYAKGEPAERAIRIGIDRADDGSVLTWEIQPGEKGNRRGRKVEDSDQEDIPL